MEWEPIDLFLSAHSPKTKVTMRCASNNLDRIFIHGACNVSNCLEQFHLYELNLGCPNVGFCINLNNLKYFLILLQNYRNLYLTCNITYFFQRLLEGVQYADVFTEKSVDSAIKKTPSILQYVNVARELFSKNKNNNNSKPHKLHKEARKRSNSHNQNPAPANSTDRLVRKIKILYYFRKKSLSIKQ